MTATVSAHPWSEGSLFGKAVIYVDRMESLTADDWQFGFWSTLALELLARAALAHISPVLLANKDDWRNITYALGRDPTAKKFAPKSISMRDVLDRLSELVPKFNEEVAGFCKSHLYRRNSELHTGELVFAALGTSEWLPHFYSVCKTLLESMDKSLADMFSDSEAAQSMIDSHKDAAAKSVQKDVNAHAQVWSNKSVEDQRTAWYGAGTWATRHSGHRVKCPACECASLLQGSPSGTVNTEFDADEVVQRQTMLPSSFECIACGLRISGLSKLSACGLGDAFTATSRYSAAEFFGLHTEDELEEARSEIPAFEEDFNEF